METFINNSKNLAEIEKVMASESYKHFSKSDINKKKVKQKILKNRISAKKERDRIKNYMKNLLNIKKKLEGFNRALKERITILEESSYY